MAELLKRLVKQGWDKEKILVSSFNYPELIALRRLFADSKLGALLHGVPVDGTKFAEELNAYSVHPSIDFISQDIVDDAHGRGLKVFVYGVDHPEDITKMRELGVDGVFTGYPERVLES